MRLRIVIKCAECDTFLREEIVSDTRILHLLEWGLVCKTCAQK